MCITLSIRTGFDMIFIVRIHVYFIMQNVINTLISVKNSIYERGFYDVNTMILNRMYHLPTKKVISNNNNKL